MKYPVFKKLFTTKKVKDGDVYKIEHTISDKDFYALKAEVSLLRFKAKNSFTKEEVDKIKKESRLKYEKYLSPERYDEVRTLLRKNQEKRVYIKRKLDKAVAEIEKLILANSPY